MSRTQVLPAWRVSAVHLSASKQTMILVVIDVVVLAVLAVLVSQVGVAAAIIGSSALLVSRWRMRLYRARFHLSSLDELPRAVVAALVAGGVLALLGVLDAPGLMDTSRVSILTEAGLIAVGVGLGLLRGPIYTVLRRLRRNDVARERLLLVGGGQVADAIAEMAESNADYGLDLAARVPDLLGVDLVNAAERKRCSTVLLAFSRASESREVFEVRRGLDAGLTIMAVPRYFDLIGEDRADDELFGVPVLRLGATRAVLGLAIKRALDFLLAAIGLIIVSPVLFVAGLLVKRETGGTALFRQTRIGMGGEPFELLKLRTVKADVAETSDTTWTVAGDGARVGPVGSFLRKTSIDELPQLWNICRGQMSFVGPRPERPHFAEQFSARYPHYQDRLRMPAGLTGLAQIHDLRGDTSIDDRARFDNRYEDHWSLWSDVKIMLKTVPKVLKGSGG